MCAFVVVQLVATLLAIYTDFSFALVGGIVWRIDTGEGAMMILIGV